MLPSVLCPTLLNPEALGEQVCSWWSPLTVGLMPASCAQYTACRDYVKGWVQCFLDTILSHTV